MGDSMGLRFADPVILSLEATWEESDTRTPLVCFLSMGSDPTNQIEALAKKLHLGKLTAIGPHCLFQVFIVRGQTLTWELLIVHRQRRSVNSDLFVCMYRMQGHINGTGTGGAC